MDRPKGLKVGRFAPRSLVLLAVLVCAGLAASVGAFLALRTSERNRQQTALEQGAAEQFGALQKVIDEDLLALELLGRFYASSEKAERAKFHEFTKPIPKHLGCLQALEWAPRVQDADRAAYEEAVRQAGFAGFEIREHDPDKGTVPAARRDEYFPVDFIEPAEGNESARGFNLASNAVRREAMEQARDTGKMRGTEPIQLVQERESQTGFLVFLPIYRKGVPTESVEDRRANLEGFVVGVFRVGDLMERALAPLAPEGIDIALYDMSAPVGERLLAWHPSPRRGESAKAPDEVNVRLPETLHYAASLRPAGRTWLVLCTPSPEFAAGAGRGYPWEALGIGLAFTALLAAYLGMTIHRTAQIERLAVRLLESNKQLEAEIGDRQRSEERYRILFESSRDALMTLAPPSWKFTSANPATVAMFGVKDVAEFASLGPWDLSPERQPDGRPSAEKAKEMIETAMREGSHFFKWTHKQLSGEDFPATVLLTRMKLAGQTLLQATVRDITAEKRAEEAVLRFRFMVENAAQEVYLVEPEGRLAYVNRAAAASLGYTVEEMLAVGVPGFDPQFGPVFRQHFEDLKARGESARDAPPFETVHIAKDGRRMAKEMRSFYLRLGDQEYVCGFGQDITERKRMEHELRRLAVIAEQAAEGIAVADLEGNLQFVNDAWAKMHGYESGAELVGRHLSIFHTDEQLKTDVIPFNDVVVQRGHNAGEVGHVRKDGTTFPAQMMVTLLKEEQGEPYGLAGFALDITERKRAEEAAAKENAKLSAMISGMDEGVVFANTDNVVVEVNDYFCRFVGKPREAILGSRIEDAHSGAVLKRVLDLINRFRANPESEPFVVQRPLGGAEVMLRMQPIYRAGRYDGVLLNVVNVTELVRARQAVEEANRRLEELATTDALTGLANRRRFMELLEAEFQRSRRYGGRLALAMVDVDRFKRFNDEHGHAFGDRVLVEVAKRLVAEARQTDLVARLGGDEFVILMPETSADEAVRAAERIRKTVSKDPVSDGEQSVPATVSVGIATVENAKAGTPESLLKQADDAMYAAKEAGRNRVCLAPSQKAVSPAP